MTEDHKAKIGRANKINMLLLWKNKKYRQHMSDVHKGYCPAGFFKMKTPEALKKMANTKRMQFRNKKNHPRYKHGLSGTPEMRVIYENRRRARKRRCKKRISFEEWCEIKREYKFRCACCKRRVKLTIDHIVPLCKGGEDSKQNVQPLCMACNQKKFISVKEYTKDD